MKKKLIVATANAHKMEEIRQILADLPFEFLTMKEAGIDIDIVEDGKTFEENAIIKARAVCEACGHMAIADDSGLVVDAMGGEPGIHSARWMGHDTSYDIKNREIIRLVDEYCAAQEGAGTIAEAQGSAVHGGETRGGAGTIAEAQETSVQGAEAKEGAGAVTAEQKAEAGVRADRVHPGCSADNTPGPLRSARFVCAVAVAMPDGTVRSATGVMEGRIDTDLHGANGFGYDPIFYLPEYGKTSAEISPQEKNRISHRGKAFTQISKILEELVE